VRITLTHEEIFEMACSRVSDFTPRISSNPKI
jgi:hypothetical protein